MIWSNQKLTVTTEKDGGVGKLAAMAVGLAVLACHLVGAPFTGPSLNPARSFVSVRDAPHPLKHISSALYSSIALMMLIFRYLRDLQSCRAIGRITGSIGSVLWPAEYSRAWSSNTSWWIRCRGSRTLIQRSLLNPIRLTKINKVMKWLEQF